MPSWLNAAFAVQPWPMMPEELNSPRPALHAPQLSRGQVAGLAFVFLWFFIGGIMHFVATDLEARIVPPWFPWPVAAVLVSGVFELLGAFGILQAATRRQAGIGLFLLTLAVTPAHVYMLQRPELFPVPLWALWLRLPIQAGLLWLILWSTGRPRRVPPVRHASSVSR